MFNNQRYITRGIESTIPIWLQNLMWYAIETLEEPKDYLQIFTFSKENDKQKFVHAQEQPPYQKEYIVDADEIVTEKVFIIDDETHTTMLLASEY